MDSVMGKENADTALMPGSSGIGNRENGDRPASADPDGSSLRSPESIARQESEDKQAICCALAQALWLTDGGSDLLALEYERDEHGNRETVVIYYLGGGKRRVNVTLDSGTAMIRDIMAVI